MVTWIKGETVPAGVTGDIHSALHFFVGLLGGGFFLLDTLVLKSLEPFGIGLVLAAKAALLECEITEVAAVNDEDVADEKRFAIDRIGFIGDGVSEFTATEGVEAGFERGDAQETPFGIGNELDEGVFLIGGGGETGEMAGDMFAVGLGVVGGEKDGAASEAGFHSIEGRLGFALSCVRAGG
jgi:hypothetical protein